MRWIRFWRKMHWRFEYLNHHKKCLCLWKIYIYMDPICRKRLKNFSFWGSIGYTYENIGAGYCNDWVYLPEGGYLEHLAEGHDLYHSDRLRECMNRCLNAFQSETPGSKGASGTTISNQAFYANNAQNCACFSGACDSPQAPSSGYISYSIVDGMILIYQLFIAFHFAQFFFVRKMLSQSFLVLFLFHFHFLSSLVRWQTRQPMT